MKHCFQMLVLSCCFFVFFSCKKDQEIVAVSSAVFKFNVPKGTCPRPYFTGTYLKDIPLDASNTAIIEVYVTTTGNYSISTNTVNGVSFADSGTFSSIGPDTIVLKGKGVPTTEGLYTLATKFDSLNCNLNFNVSTPATLKGFITCKIDGTNYSFNDSITSRFSNAYDGETFFAFGKTKLGGGEQLGIGLSKPTGRIQKGTYLHDGSQTALNDHYNDFQYIDSGNGFWYDSEFPLRSDPFTIIITGVSANRMQGTFSGIIRDGQGSGNNTKTISDGMFDVPIK